jgi:hypothetical protein
MGYVLGKYFEIADIDEETAMHRLGHRKPKVEQSLKMRNLMPEAEGPCWKGYQQVGMKMKNGREVPNCVPKNESVVNESITGVVGAIALAALGLELLASDGDGGMITKIIRDIKAKYKGEKTSAEAWEAVVKDYEIRKFVRNNANDIVKKGKNYNSKELENLVQQKLNKNESVVKEISGRTPKIFVKTAAVEKKIKELMADRKKAVVPYNNEKDPKKKEILKQILIKLTKQIQGYEKNLVQLRDMEEEYIQQMNADAELDTSAFD